MAPAMQSGVHSYENANALLRRAGGRERSSWMRSSARHRKKSEESQREEIFSNVQAVVHRGVFVQTRNEESFVLCCLGG